MSELVKRSPLRILEQSIHGGLGAGNIGVFSSPKGLGKTACLVHIATDKLFQGQHVIHVSFAARTDHIIRWYEDIFGEIVDKRELSDVVDVHDEIIRNRVIMNFSQEGTTADQLLRSLRAMITDGGFAADVLVVDGYDFVKGSPESIAAIKSFAEELGIAVWFSASSPEDPSVVDERGVPSYLSAYVDLISVLITLEATPDFIKLRLVKDHQKIMGDDLHVRLDSKSLLIVER
ncbi:MAG: hypothetical protein EA428_00220 [Spirochaetaceae bacterium]|nr:MAG: hypothetical protein EA428_00220 [Spirochaetaceae bacterium]